MQGVRGGEPLPAPAHQEHMQGVRGGEHLPHQRQRSQCKECGGKSICAHHRRRSPYKECGGAILCSLLLRWCGQMLAPPALLAFAPLALVRADARPPAMQGVRGGEHLPAPARQQRGWEITAHTHLYSHSASEDSTPKTGLPPASVCSTLRCVHYSAYTPLLSKRVRRPHPEGRACPCERVFHAQVCARQSLHTFTLVAHPKIAPRRPLRAYAPRSGVCTSAPTHLYSRSASEDRATTAGLAAASVCDQN